MSKVLDINNKIENSKYFTKKLNEIFLTANLNEDSLYDISTFSLIVVLLIENIFLSITSALLSRLLSNFDRDS